MNDIEDFIQWAYESFCLSIIDAVEEEIDIDCSIIDYLEDE